MADDKLFNYYERQDVLPTFGNFKSSAELEAYAGDPELLTVHAIADVRRAC